MNEQISVHFGLSPEEREKFGETLLREIGFAGDSRFGVIMKFKSDDARLARVRATLRKYGVEFRESLMKIYSSAELLQFPLLLLGVKGVAGAGPVYYGTTYNFDKACPTCFAGWKYSSAVFVDTNKMGKKEIAGTYDGEIIVTKRIASLLEQCRFSGLALHPVYHHTRRDIPSGYAHLTSDAGLPPFCKIHSQYYLTDELCPKCGRSGFFCTTAGPLELAYHTSDLPPGTWSDLNVTWELFGYYKKAEETEVKLPIVSHPQLVVSSRVAEFFLTHKIRGVSFDPVFLLKGKCSDQTKE